MTYKNINTMLLIITIQIFNFFTYIGEHKYRYSQCLRDFVDDVFDVTNRQNADFIDITLRYGPTIIDTCEKWGYDRIIKWIKDNN